MSISQTFDWALHDHAKFQVYLPNIYNLQDRRRATLIKPIVLQYLKHKESFMSAYINSKDVQSNKSAKLPVHLFSFVNK